MHPHELFPRFGPIRTGAGSGRYMPTGPVACPAAHLSSKSARVRCPATLCTLSRKRSLCFVDGNGVKRSMCTRPPITGGGKLRGGIISPWDISQRVYLACNLEFAVGNFAPTCCEPTFGWCWLLLLTDALQLSPRGLLFLPGFIAGSWLWTRLLSIIFHPCKECSKLQAKFASVPCVQQ